MLSRELGNQALNMRQNSDRYHVSQGTTPVSETQLPHQSETVDCQSPPEPELQHNAGQHQSDPPVILQHIDGYQRNINRFGAVMYYEHFRFVNLDKLRSFESAVQGVHEAIQTVLHNLQSEVRPGDLVQLRFEGDGFDRPLYSLRKGMDGHLNNVSGLLQSNAECIGSGCLRLVIIILRNRAGGIMKRRKIRSTTYSSLINTKRRWLFNFNNYDSNLCLAASLKALLDEKRNITDSELIVQAREMHKTLCIPDEHLVNFSDIQAFEKLLNVTIKILYHNQGSWQYFYTDGPCKDKVLFVLHHNEHYYGIKNIKAFIGHDYFCQYCHSIFHHKNNHSCKYFCRTCHRQNCVEVKDEICRCLSCHLVCRSVECLALHNALAQEGEVECHTKVYCDMCCAYVRKDGHDCTPPTCSICHGEIDIFDTHLCYMTPYKPPKKETDYIVYDFECMQETGVHIPNYVYAKKLDDTKSWEFQGSDCLKDFVNHFVTTKFQSVTFIAHNGGRYDSYLVVQQLIKEKLAIKLLAQGGKLLCVTVPDLKIRFIDSLNFLPMKLSKLPKALGFKESKGHFPHFFNTGENQNYIGSMPCVDHYGVEYMMLDEKAEFLKWYEENKHETFDFQTALKIYCKQDVEVLRLACVCFRESVMDMTWTETIKFNKNGELIEDINCIDPFQLTTLALVCMAMYRFKFLPNHTIAILPCDNYHKTQKRYSTPAIQWLMYVAHKEGIAIQHALRGGERRVGKYCLDGYAVINNVPTAFEFQGCFYHGCPVCYNENDTNEVTDSTYSQLYNKYIVKKLFLQSCGFEVRVLWEHEWLAMLAKDKELQAFIIKNEFPQPLDPRDALYGGRTNAIKLYHKTAPGESIHYYDFTSLYPFVNKTKAYPVGHPRIIYENFRNMNFYFGLAKVKMLPPRGLFFPVLPLKLNGKLMFPLCLTCATNNSVTQCDHSDEQRALTGTWCTIEIQFAVEKGYKISKIYEIWHFENYKKNLFENYIKLHLRDKQEASGYPAWCTDDEKKTQYIQDYKKKRM
ncbi:uncharacterized protein LOC128663189 isoform X1 [Bombina bombina]|uniref:uncharacterized protein LOC128663189 isoform X1 n=1 Tax=Bombina bombina TaxID=8345 RepID=UPI00235ABDDD|nr:uncharacterized protein LOC128663189 isoform X1 [Bombina bombina]XP_053573372.1 uncharacterized protein LOC128663189 isoform X1 [Bombina bombina]XP_053573373.1 uncharacterized protein LOC128663189 isoform X1 [Bombina bombina]